MLKTLAENYRERRSKIYYENSKITKSGLKNLKTYGKIIIT